MKKYQIQAICSAPISEAETFGINLNENIKKFQDKGMIVEVQFSTSETRFSALVLGYKDEVK